MTTGDVFDIDAVDQVGQPAGFGASDDAVPWDQSGPPSLDITEQFQLYNVPDGFHVIARRGGVDGPIKSFADPPMGIAPGEMQDHLIESDAFGFPHPVSGHHAALAEGGATLEEGHVFRVGLASERP